jgi:hypothetical protein
MSVTWGAVERDPSGSKAEGGCAHEPTLSRKKRATRVGQPLYFVGSMRSVLLKMLK